MNNYITIESGYYEPFKENETDPELKIWADKQYEIIKRIHEVLLPYNENFEHFVELENRIDELKREIQYFSKENRYILSFRDSKGQIREDKKDQMRELLLQSSFIDEMNSLFDDDEICFLNSPDYHNEDKQDLLWRFQHISDFFSCANKYIKQLFSKESIRSLAVSAVDDLVELKEELRKCLLHRVWKSYYSLLIKESNIVSVQFINYDESSNKNGYLLFRTCSPWNMALYLFKRLGDCSGYCYEDKDKINRDYFYFSFGSRLKAKLDNNTFEMTYSIINDIRSKGDSPLSGGFLSYFVSGFVDISTNCSIIETYKEFQSGNIEKVIKDKIKCGDYDFYSDFHCHY